MRTMIVCESPWRDNGGPIKPYSMRPFVEGIAYLFGARLVYRTFTTGDELRQLLKQEAFDEKMGRIFLYVTAHGCGSRLYPASDMRKGINLAQIGKSLRSGVEGVWLGACLVGSSPALNTFLNGGGSIFAGGYKCEVGWESSAKLDLSILEAWLSWNGTIRSRKDATSLFCRALKCFSPEWVIGTVEDGKRDITLQDGFQILARNATKGPTVAYITDDILRRLGWRDEGRTD